MESNLDCLQSFDLLTWSHWDPVVCQPWSQCLKFHEHISSQHHIGRLDTLGPDSLWHHLEFCSCLQQPTSVTLWTLCGPGDGVCIGACMRQGTNCQHIEPQEWMSLWQNIEKLHNEWCQEPVSGLVGSILHIRWSGGSGLGKRWEHLSQIQSRCH